ncbi:hypothetical protein ACIRRA_39840 [Nocardia sp. NPDC101769]|uniref:hypothetical protein n=1 Tax=Nocardia sp. NPDC101769 TaxID=3364333 RepID=UPI0038120838
MGATIEGACWLAFLAGVVLFGRGMWHGVRTQQLLGVGIAFYALALRFYARLGVSGARAPLTTDERVWSVSLSVAAGTSMLALLLLIARKKDGTAPGTNRPQTLWLCGSAIVSAIALRVVMWLPGPTLAPSTDFLNAYGSDLRVVVYELIFAAWLGLPLGALGVFVWRYQRGVARWYIFAGCMAGVGWAIWKIAGTAVRYVTGEAIPLESPVSVAVGLASLVLINGGLIGGQIGTAVRRARETREYMLARRADDERHATPAPDSTDSPAA